MRMAKGLSMIAIAIVSILALLPAIHVVTASSSPPDQITNTSSSTSTLPESSQRVFQNSRGTMANYVFYGSGGTSGTCYYADSVDGVAWTRDQTTTLGNSFPICSVAYREDTTHSRTLVYIVGSKLSDGFVGSNHNILFNIRTSSDSSA